VVNVQVINCEKENPGARIPLLMGSTFTRLRSW